MFKLHDEVVCVSLPFQENMQDAPNARHHLTVGKFYKVLMINYSDVTGQWLVMLRDDLKRGSYHESNFRLVVDGQVVANPLPAPPPKQLAAPQEDAIDVLQAAAS